jgi:hypothetical protein
LISTSLPKPVTIIGKLAELKKKLKTLFSFFGPQNTLKQNAPQVRSPNPIQAEDPVDLFKKNWN